MHNRSRFANVLWDASVRPGYTALLILLMLLFLISLLVFLAFTAQSAQAQTYKVLYNFTGGADGAGPITGLTMDGAGNLYGTTVWGGVSGCDTVYGCGTVFKLTRAPAGWSFSRLYAFAWSDGSGPNSKVVFGPDGNLYGATAAGGSRGNGAVFGLTPERGPSSILGSWSEGMLYSIIGGPWGDILMDEQSGQIYGVTIIGGEGYGVVYKANPGGVVYTFHGPPNDGNGPQAGVIFDRYRNLCGTTATGGRTQMGIVFCVSASGYESILYNFQGHDDGAEPEGGLVVDQSGNLYGTTSTGGSGGGGTVFMLSPSGGGWVYTLLYSFTGYGGPIASLTMDAGGNLYGTTGADGAHSAGNVFKLTRSGGNWIYTSLHDFTFGSDGGAPESSVLIDANGNLYGTASYGGLMSCDEPYGCGVVWEITP